MSKLGRNDPCPCGSGKKYKKCCLAQDEKRRIEETRPDDLSALFEDIQVRTDLYDDSDEPEALDGTPYAEIDQEPYVAKTIGDDVPEISEQEEALVNAWWTDYKTMKESDDILRHLRGFLQAHPSLVENLELHHEVLFELGAQLVKEGRAGDYIELLKEIRQRFPRAYLKSYSYFDRDLIVYEVVERGCSAGIEDYLPWLEEYPEEGVDNLFQLLEFLMVAECDAVVMRLIEATYYPLFRSPNVLGGGELLEPLILGYLASSLNGEPTATDLQGLVERLKGIRAPLRPEWYDPRHLQTLMQEITGDLGREHFEAFDATEDVAQYYDGITRNFMGWLHREQGMSWMKAHFYRDQVRRYLLRVVPEGKRPKQPFTFTKQLLDRTLADNARELFSPNPTVALGSINAIHWFAEYLAERQAITDERRTDVQRWCQDLWNAIIPMLRETRIEAGLFKALPQ
ncbi:YecA family protein [Halochromatium roseum]|uniref:YecA family protein n=1 Tax=Halochromatium roseum TaxID=391920 RepID=UPI001F5D6602|nr:SEC-C metal-binding domain-containing protein [Halochromatium roseum]MBK5941749.1 hypothetical protein [Halochromatium roseum]